MKNKFLAILLSAVVAFGLWLYVITVVSPESEKSYYEIPVVLQNKNILSERGLMIVSDVPTVTLVLRSDRTILNDLNEANINVITNVANIEKPGTHNLTYTVSYPGNVPPNSVSVQSSSTDLITVRVENRVRKTIPIVIDYDNTAVPEGYIADLKNVQLDHTSVEISGPESVMNQIHQAVIGIDLTQKTQTVVGEFQYVLCNESGMPVDAEKVTTNVEKVNLQLKVKKVKEIALNVEIVSGGGATEQTSTITIDPMKLWVSGSDALLEGLDSLNVGTINLGEIPQDQVLTFPIVLPDGVDNETGVEQVTVDIKFPQLLTKNFRVNNIVAVNVPEGLRVNMITESLQVTLRGPIDLVSAMQDSDVTISVDFSGQQAGMVTLNAEVLVGDAFAGVGAVKTYQVSANLQDK